MIVFLQTTPRGVHMALPAPSPERVPAAKRQPSSSCSPFSVFSSVCLKLVKILASLGLLVGVLTAILLALPGTGDAEEEESTGMIMGNWDAAFFCEDDLQRAGRIMKATNYIARSTGLSNGHTDGAEACGVVRQTLVLHRVRAPWLS